MGARGAARGDGGRVARGGGDVRRHDDAIVCRPPRRRLRQVGCAVHRPGDAGDDRRRVWAVDRENHFDGYIAEVRIWNRARPTRRRRSSIIFEGHLAPPRTAGTARRSAAAPPGSPPLLTLTISPTTHHLPQAHWRPIDAKLDEPDGRVLVHNAAANRAHATTTLDAMLKRNVATYPLELTLRPGVRAVLVELGSMLRHSPQRRGVEMVSRHNCYKHYCYLGTSVALQKSLLQATGAILAQSWRNSAQFGAMILTASAACCRRSTSTPTSSSRSGCRAPTTTTTTPEEAARRAPPEASRRPRPRLRLFRSGSSRTRSPTCASATATAASSGASATPTAATPPPGDRRPGRPLPAALGGAARRLVVRRRAAVPGVLPRRQADPRRLPRDPPRPGRHGVHSVEAEVPRARRVLPHLLPAVSELHPDPLAPRRATRRRAPRRRRSRTRRRRA